MIGQISARCRSATSFDPASNQHRANFEPASVMEFGFYRAQTDVLTILALISPLLRSCMMSTLSWCRRPQSNDTRPVSPFVSTCQLRQYANSVFAVNFVWTSFKWLRLEIRNTATDDSFPHCAVTGLSTVHQLSLSFSHQSTNRLTVHRLWYSHICAEKGR